MNSKFSMPGLFVLSAAIAAFAAIQAIEINARPATLAQSEQAAKIRDAFLADDAGADAFRALLNAPEALEEKDVRMKIFRSLTSRDLQIFEAAFEVAMRAPRLSDDPNIARRLNVAFSSRDAQKKKIILDFAVKHGMVRDMRVLSLLSETLVDSDKTVADTAYTIVNSDKSLQENPAINEALARRPDFQGKKIKLPDFDSFKQNVQPLFEVLGSDEKACHHCHDTHPIFRLNATESGKATNEQIMAQYRSSLRVINLSEPEKSLLLVKPSSPAPPDESEVARPDSHGGGVRWVKGSPEYQKVLDWIRTGK
ncbi:MAG TPA: hypothetical protein VGK99_16885 [Acidobacteriota bacterium]|jgi:hypothetical protein